MIPMVDLKQQYLALKPELDKQLLKALEDTQFILGPNVRAFEEEAAEYIGTRHAISCASGTDALHLAMSALGIGQGDEVITAANGKEITGMPEALSDNNFFIQTGILIGLFAF